MTFDWTPLIATATRGPHALGARRGAEKYDYRSPAVKPVDRSGRVETNAIVLLGTAFALNTDWLLLEEGFYPRGDVVALEDADVTAEGRQKVSRESTRFVITLLEIRRRLYPQERLLKSKSSMLEGALDSRERLIRQSCLVIGD